MLSRVADSIFWMSRYIERAENVARFIDVNLHLAIDLGTEGVRVGRPVGAAGRHDRRPRAVRRAVRRARPAQGHRVSDVRRAQPELDSVLPARPRENARTVREMISSAMWEELNKFYLMVRGRQGGRGLSITTPTTSSSRSSCPAICSKASPSPRCRTARPGTSPAWAGCWSGPTRRRASWT